LVVLALGGATFAFLGGGSGCSNFALYANYQTMFQDMGEAAIAVVSDTYFDDGVADSNYDTIVRTPGTAFAQSVWDNWVDARIPDDLPNNPIVKR
jgi:hypothetical protein